MIQILFLEAFTPSIVIKKKRPNNDKLNIDDEETTTLEVFKIDTTIV